MSETLWLCPNKNCPYIEKLEQFTKCPICKNIAAEFSSVSAYGIIQIKKSNEEQRIRLKRQEEIKKLQQELTKLKIEESKGKYQLIDFPKKDMNQKIEKEETSNRLTIISCPYCRKDLDLSTLPVGTSNCPFCGNDLYHKRQPTSKPSDLWFLLPLLFGLLGSIIGYVGVKDRDEDMAIKLLFIGAAFTILAFFAYFFWISSFLRIF